MHSLSPYCLNGLKSLGTRSDLEFLLTLGVRRGEIRTVHARAYSPLDSGAYENTCAAAVPSGRDVIPILEALCIESAIMWSQPPLPGTSANQVHWYDPDKIC